MSISWTQTIGDAVTRAYRLLGNLSAPWVPSDDQMTQGIIVGNLILKGLEAEGISLFRQTQVSLAIPALAQTVVFPLFNMGLEEVRWVVTPAPNLYEQTLGALTYVQFQQLPNKLSQAARPTTYMYDRQTTSAQLWLWPLANQGGTINCTVGRIANDVLQATDPIDLPSEWMVAFDYLLADGLMDDQGTAAADQATAQRIAGRAVFWRQKLLDFDRPYSVFIRPLRGQGWSRGRNYR
jgi:hypothetical protein